MLKTFVYIYIVYVLSMEAIRTLGCCMCNDGSGWGSHLGCPGFCSGDRGERREERREEPRAVREPPKEEFHGAVFAVSRHFGRIQAMTRATHRQA